MTKIWRYFFSFLLLAVLLVFIAAVSFPDDKLHLVICNVGQGDGILIYRKTTQIVMDGGPNDAILGCLSRHMPFWDHTLEQVILTNPDADHYTGLLKVLKSYKVTTFVDPAVLKDDYTFTQLQNEIKANKADHLQAFEGDTTRTNSFQLKALWPTRTWFAQEKQTASKVLGESIVAKGTMVNELSLVYELSYGNFKALLTGDVAPPASDNKDFVGLIQPVTVLKVPHHGSKNGLILAMLQAANPQLAVISVGRNNQYGHPDQETLDLLERQNVRILRTDQKGEIEIVTDGKSWSVK